MDEYTGTQEEEEKEMGIPNISTHELIPVQEDEDINNFITELFNENNTLPKCELDQWLEDYLEEMELHNQQQQQEGEQSQEQSLLDMCEYSDISSVEEEENSPSSGQCKENNDENYVDEQDHYGDNLYNFCNCIFCSRSTIYGAEQGGEGGGGNIDTEPVTIQCGGGIPSMYGDDQQQNHEKEQEEKEEEEEILVGDNDLIVNVFNFPNTFFILN